MVCSLLLILFIVPLSVYGQCEIKILPDDGAPLNWFGYSVSISNGMAVIGARFDDDNGTMSGSAYIFNRNGAGRWVQQAKLLPVDGAAGDAFGFCVSISGNAVIVGARDADETELDSGAAYIFRYDGFGNWVQEAKLTAFDDAESDRFGTSVSIDGDIAVVGEDKDDDNGMDSGSAFVYKHVGSGNWVLLNKLVPDDGASEDMFGSAVAVSGDTIIVGAWSDDDNGIDAGSVYVFQDDGADNWTQQNKILAADGAEGDWFGRSLTIDGLTAVVSSYMDDDMGQDSGSVYVYLNDGMGNWTEEAKLVANDGNQTDRFGVSVAVESDVMAVGAYWDDDNGIDSGSVYQFRNDGNGNWLQDSKIVADDGIAGDYFGRAVAISGNMMIAGADLNDQNGENAGCAYIIRLNCATPILGVKPDPLIAGQNGTFTVSNTWPYSKTYLAYSLRGMGSMNVPFLNITLDLQKPAQAGDTILSDVDGTAKWVLAIPKAGAGRNIWFQACQYELVTNVVSTSIEP